LRKAQSVGTGIDEDAIKGNSANLVLSKSAVLKPRQIG
jgi:hypothetical protein